MSNRGPRLPVFGEPAVRSWSADEDAVLMSHTTAEASRLLDRTVGACRSRRSTLIARGDIEATPEREWTGDEDALFTSGKTVEQIAAATGRTVNGVKARRTKLAKQRKAVSR